MTFKIKISTIIIFLMIAFSGCIKEGLEECPGNIRIHVYAEKFQNASENPLDSREDIFRDIIKHLRYYVYKDGRLFDHGLLTDLSSHDGAFYTFNYSNVEYGDYTMALVANSSADALKGDHNNPENLWLAFPGCPDTEDYFTAVFPFTIDSEELKEYEVGLLRAHGVLSFKFSNMPDDINNMELSVEKVGSEKWIMGDYMNSCIGTNSFIRKIDDGDDAEYIIGTFPTFPNEPGIYRLVLYRDGAKADPYFSDVISEDIIVRRNQLTQVITDFNGGNVTFEINMDVRWDGTSPNYGGELD